jgi:hypothetical protein
MLTERVVRGGDYRAFTDSSLTPFRLLLHNLAVAARALELHLYVAELDGADELDRRLLR